MTWWRSVLRRRALIKPGFDPLPDLSLGCADAAFLLLRPDGMGRRSWTTESTEASQPQHQLLGHLRAVPHDYSLLDDRRRFSPGMVRPAQDWSALAVKDPLPTLPTPVFSAPPLSWHLWKIKMRNAFCFYDKQVISMIFFFYIGRNSLKRRVFSRPAPIPTSTFWTWLLREVQKCVMRSSTEPRIKGWFFESLR